jgi:hypothetical protein
VEKDFNIMRSCKLLSSSIVYTMFDFVIYKMDKYFTEMKMRIIELFTFGNGDDKYVIISEYNGNDIWLLDEFCPNNN